MRTPRLSLALAFLLLAACGDDDGTEAAAPEGVIYESGATDEAWIAIDEAPVVTDFASAPHLTAPTSIFRAAPPTAFSWSAGALATLQHRPHRRGGNARASLLATIFGPAVARAHEPPVTGDQYRLILSVGSGEPIRVLTGATTWTPDAATWARIAGATAPVSVEIVGAYLMSGRVTEGPFASSEPTSIPFGE